MRKVVVCNFVTLDGFYEATDKTFDGFFDFYHPDYAGDQMDQCVARCQRHTHSPGIRRPDPARRQD